MSRCALAVRDAGPEDVADLLRLWEHDRRNAPMATPRPEEEAHRALAQIAADPDERMLVGFVDGELVASLHLRRAPLSPLHTETAAPATWKNGFDYTGNAHQQQTLYRIDWTGAP